MAASGGYWKGGSFIQLNSSQAFNERLGELMAERQRLTKPRFPGTKDYRDYQTMKEKEKRTVSALNDFLAKL